jgi:hypothetical protein
MSAYHPRRTGNGRFDVTNSELASLFGFFLRGELISHVEAQAYIGFWHKADMPVVLSEAIAAVVFDLDGVLLNSGSDWDAAWRKVAARNGGRWQADATRVMMGMSSPEWSRYMHDQLGVPLEPKHINELVVAALLDHFRRRRPLLPGAVAAACGRLPRREWS